MVFRSIFESKSKILSPISICENSISMNMKELLNESIVISKIMEVESLSNEKEADKVENIIIEEEIGKSGFLKTFLKYIFSVGIHYAILSISIFLFQYSLKFASDLWITYWFENKYKNLSKLQYNYVYIILFVLTLFTFVIGYYVYSVWTFKSILFFLKYNFVEIYLFFIIHYLFYYIFY